jgi:hypothetical protein
MKKESLNRDEVLGQFIAVLTRMRLLLCATSASSAVKAVVAVK